MVMKKLLVLGLLVLFGVNLNAQDLDIKDENLLYYLTETRCVELYSRPDSYSVADKNRDKIIQKSEAEDIKVLNLGEGLDFVGGSIVEWYQVDSRPNYGVRFENYDPTING